MGNGDISVVCGLSGLWGKGARRDGGRHVVYIAESAVTLSRVPGSSGAVCASCRRLAWCNAVKTEGPTGSSASQPMRTAGDGRTFAGAEGLGHAPRASICIAAPSLPNKLGSIGISKDMNASAGYVHTCTVPTRQ